MGEQKQTFFFSVFSESWLRQLLSTGMLSGVVMGSLAPPSSGETLSDVIIHEGSSSTVSGDSVWSDAQGVGVSGGTLYVRAGGSASATVLDSGLVEVSSDDTASPVVVTGTVVNGGELFIRQNGLAKNTVMNGGTMTLTSDDPAALANAEGSIVNRGTMRVLQNGAVSNTALYSYGVMDLWGTADNTRLTSGASLQVNGLARNTSFGAGSQASINTAYDGVTDPLLGGRMEHTVINGGRLWNRYGTDSDTIVNTGGVLETGSAKDVGRIDNGISRGATINNGGFQYVNNGGTSMSSRVNSGGRLFVLYDLHNDGDLDLGVTASGTANDTLLYGEMENNGGTDNRTHVFSGGSYHATGSQTDGQVALSNNALIDPSGQATLHHDSLATGWTIQGDVRLDSERARLSDSRIEGGNVWVDSGAVNNITLTGGQLANISGTDSNTVVSNGAHYYLGAVAAAMSDSLTVEQGAYADINSGTLTNGTFSGSVFVSANPYVPETTSTLLGTFQINDGGKLTLLPGVNSVSADMTINDSGALYFASNSSSEGDWRHHICSLTLNGGRVIFDAVGGGGSYPGWTSLTLDSLNGHGTFAMNTSIADLKGDFLTVTGNADGNFGVLVADSGKSPATGASLPLIRTGGGAAAFTLANAGGVVDAGTWEYHLTGDGKGGWVLTSGQEPIPPDDDTPPPEDDMPTADEGGNPDGGDNGGGQDDNPHPDDGHAGEDDNDGVPDTADTTPPPDNTAPADKPAAPDTPVVPAPEPVRRIITPSAAAVLDMASVLPQVFQTELGAIRQHLEARRTGHDSNLWATTFGREQDVALRPDAGYQLNTYGLTLGADRNISGVNAAVTWGGYFSASDSQVAFDRGGDGKVKGYALGTYASYQHQSGMYLDGIVEVSHFSNDVNARITSGHRAVGHYTSQGLGAHLQAGKVFTAETSRQQTYIAPYMALSGFVSGGSEYSLSNSLHARIGSIRSLQAEAGLSVGRTWTMKKGITLQPWLGAAAIHEFVTSNRVETNHDGHFANDLSGTRGSYQGGVRSQLTPRLAAHIDATCANGAGIASPWSFNAGVSYRW